MAHGEHKYDVSVQWTGNRGSGTSGYRAYGRDHVITSGGKPAIPGSADPAFLGDAERWNPEDLLVASASACHKLWYLHLCSDAGIIVLDYRDDAEGTMLDDPQQGPLLADRVAPARGDPGRWRCGTGHASASHGSRKMLHREFGQLSDSLRAVRFNRRAVTGIEPALNQH
ncbi:organic hydroperoxide reductase OsmC/OhrA [Paraburkholderia bryophila]|uniref:Organic hydroperoxide reductase OsmC/OhrA n=1 Tax=Paraburkholderia bryophila TaxID=420952 RepID=A0A7Y9W5I0_9BURK|nr:organic hydroperoxide reductase OsmC/OhrA [Paraburkholderia bryophila]